MSLVALSQSCTAMNLAHYSPSMYKLSLVMVGLYVQTDWSACHLQAVYLPLIQAVYIPLIQAVYITLIQAVYIPLIQAVYIPLIIVCACHPISKFI